MNTYVPNSVKPNSIKRGLLIAVTTLVLAGACATDDVVVSAGDSEYTRSDLAEMAGVSRLADDDVPVVLLIAQFDAELTRRGVTRTESDLQNGRVFVSQRDGIPIEDVESLDAQIMAVQIRLAYAQLDQEPPTGDPAERNAALQNPELPPAFGAATQDPNFVADLTVDPVFGWGWDPVNGPFPLS